MISWTVGRLAEKHDTFHGERITDEALTMSAEEGRIIAHFTPEVV